MEGEPADVRGGGQPPPRLSAAPAPEASVQRSRGVGGVPERPREGNQPSEGTSVHDFLFMLVKIFVRT